MQLTAEIQNPDENAIISSAQKGDNEAIEYLLKKYRRIVLSCARYYYLPGAEKEDLIQEGMIALYHAIKGYNYRHPFPAFAKTCIVRKMCTAVRLYNKQKNRILSNAFYLGEPIFENDVETFLDRVPAKNIDPCDLIAYKDERNEMLNNVQKNLSCFKEIEKLLLDSNGPPNAKWYSDGLSVHAQKRIKAFELMKTGIQKNSDKLIRESSQQHTPACDLDSRLLITRIFCTSNKINRLSDYAMIKHIVMLITRNESTF